MLVLFTCVSSRQGEDVTAARNLQCLLIDILVNFATTAPELPEPDPLASCNENHSKTTAVSGTPTSSQSPPEPAITSKGISTETLLQIKESIQKQQESKERMYKSRAVVRRLSQQEEELVQLAKTIHHGRKQDFLSALTHSVTTSTCSSSNSLIQDEDWDGSLTPQDISALAKKAYDPQKRMTVYDTNVVESAPYYYHLGASDALDIQDTTSATEIVRALRRKLPGFLDFQRKVNGVKAKYMKEFEILWKPERTHSGWQIKRQCP